MHSNNYATGEVNGTTTIIGGFAGEVNKNPLSSSQLIISNNYATGNVTGIETWSGVNIQVGGFIGFVYSGIIKNNYATGAVKGSRRVGGLIGDVFEAQVENSYATGAVEGNSGVGGLIGWINSTPLFKAEVKNSYATGAVKGNDKVGGFLGFLGENTTISNSFQTDKKIFLMNMPEVGFVLDGVKIISASGQIKEDFTAWNFSTIWASFSGTNWPTLQNMGLK